MPISTKINRLSRVGFINLNLTDFETIKECLRRQKEMAARFLKSDYYSQAKTAISCLQKCNTKNCCDACFLASRMHRYRKIRQAMESELFVDRRGYFVTWAPPHWAVEGGKLKNFDIARAIQETKHQLEELGDKVVALGSIDLSWNIELDGRAFWQLHLHLVIVGAGRKRVKAAFSSELPTVGWTELKTKKITDLPGALNYSMKRIFECRKAYTAKNGRVNRRHIKLPLPMQLEADKWLSHNKLGFRTIKWGY